MNIGYNLVVAIIFNKGVHSMKQKKYEKSRYIDSFHLAGFEYYDGLDIIDELMIGTKVFLVLETDNPHDADAIAIYYGKTKLGYGL